MKKIKLNKKEKGFLRELKEVEEKMMKMKLDYKSKAANFWKEFQEKHGVGNYRMNIEEKAIESLSAEEALEEARKG